MYEESRGSNSLSFRRTASVLDASDYELRVMRIFFLGGEPQILDVHFGERKRFNMFLILSS